MADTRERILDAAERRVRAGGYGAFSFRDIAEDVGVKSASVHHHFATKAILTRALVERYVQRVKARLGDPVGQSPRDAIDRLTAVFREAAVDRDEMCLCGMLASERDGLPTEVADAAAGFFDAMIEHLAAAFGAAPAALSPEAVVAGLEGALLVARATRAPARFDVIVAEFLGLRAAA